MPRFLKHFLECFSLMLGIWGAVTACVVWVWFFAHFGVVSEIVGIIALISLVWAVIRSVD